MPQISTDSASVPVRLMNFFSNTRKGMPSPSHQAARYEISDHCDGEQFRNVQPQQAVPLGEVLRWQRQRPPNSWPKWIEDPALPPPERVSAEQIAVTFIGHASFYIQFGGLRFLIDPVYAQRASPLSFVGPRRVRRPGQPLAALPDVDVVLISHNHYDHLDKACLRTVAASWPIQAVTGLGVDRLLRKCGLPVVTALDWWQSTDIGGVRITYVPAQHFSARTPFDRNKTLWGGFVLEAGGRSLYFAADSGYCPHFSEIGARFPNLDLALIPIGAYEPRWFMKPMHMDPAEAVQSFRDVGARRAIGMHFGTFSGLTDEAIDAPVRGLAQAKADQGIAGDAFITLAFGETYVVPD
jgi:L-ascorbate metabolism protein UlaG (beta-lactamase superfamily)